MVSLYLTHCNYFLRIIRVKLDEHQSHFALQINSLISLLTFICISSNFNRRPSFMSQLVSMWEIYCNWISGFSACLGCGERPCHAKNHDWSFKKQWDNCMVNPNARWFSSCYWRFSVLLVTKIIVFRWLMLVFVC